MRLMSTYVMRVALMAVFSSAVPPDASAQRAVFVVRHAEKVDESEDPALSAAGERRAEALARLLRTAGVSAAYVTQYQRTRLTAAPICAALGVKPIVVHSDAVEELVDRLRRHHADDVVLVVGHSGSVPRVLKRLGHPSPVEIGHDEYDSVFVIAPRETGSPTVLRLRYGS